MWLFLVLLTPGTAHGETEPLNKKYSPWQSEKNTWFLASASDVGIVYVRPHATLGWGAPFWQFVGLDTYAITTPSFAAAYVGVRASLPWLDVQWGYRGTYAFDRRLLPPRSEYRADDLHLSDGDKRSTYGVIELEITPAVPVLHGALFAEIHPMWFNAPRDVYLYEEIMRAVVDSRFAMRTRLGYLYQPDDDGMIKVGAMLEYMVTPGRPKNVARVGPVVLVGLSKHIEGLATATFAVSSPDDLGLYEGTYGFIGLRARFAQRF